MATNASGLDWSFTPKGKKVEIDVDGSLEVGNLTIDVEGDGKLKSQPFKLDFEADLDFGRPSLGEGSFETKIRFDKKDQDYQVELEIEYGDRKIEVDGDYDPRRDLFTFELERDGGDDGGSGGEFSGSVRVPDIERPADAFQAFLVGLDELFA